MRQRHLRTFVASAPASVGFGPLVSWPQGGRFSFAIFRDVMRRRAVARFGVWFESRDESGGEQAASSRVELVSVDPLPGRDGEHARRVLVVEPTAADWQEDNLGRGVLVPFPETDRAPWELRVTTVGSPSDAGLHVVSLDVWLEPLEPFDCGDPTAPIDVADAWR